VPTSFSLFSRRPQVPRQVRGGKSRESSCTKLRNVFQFPSVSFAFNKAKDVNVNVSPRSFRRCMIFAFLFATSFALAQQLPSSLGDALKWRAIGPLRGGRTRSAAGVPSQPNVFYMGVCNGGVWKTTDYGRTWQPLFDQQPTGSIGSLAVAESDPSTIYAASGEGLHRPDLSIGDGVYKSTDAGKTWTHLGLRDGQQIPDLAIDPKDPNRVFFAVAGHPYGPNAERGVFLTTDGGQTYKKVLYKDENVGASDVKFDPSDSQTVYATLWEAREGPWENAAWNGTGGGIYKSTDGGTTWKQLSGGLPEGIIQAHIAISRSDPKRLIASVATQGKVQIYGSSDAGATWAVVTDDKRPAGRIGGGDLPVPIFDPKNPEVVYSISTVTWKSVDGGKTWKGFRGAPGGDDYQNVWINPNDGNTILLVADQGAIVTVNGGASWSSWYNQPTAQMYHVSTDNAFPYRVCGGQQESGSACVSSRGNDGAITFREWHPVAAEEYAYVQADPNDPDILYGGSIDEVTRWDRRTAQVTIITPRPLRAPDYRAVRTEPLVFAADGKTMFYTSNTVWKSTDRGDSWQQISPDLTRKTWETPASVGKFKDQKTALPTQKGVVYTLSPSPVEPARLWAGTDDGLIQLTVDAGAHWTDVTPKTLSPWQKVSMIEASHSNPQVAYAAINTLRLDDLRPHILRTRDGGKTWSEIVAGLPESGNINVVREDTKQKGLLFAGSETSVYVSTDDGDHWQSLRLNLPASSVRDLAIKNNDLVAATHGRGFWILDDISALRQLASAKTVDAATLFAPATATRVRWNMNTDTPLPPDEPMLGNPPDGAVIDYMLAAGASGPVTLEIRDSSGKTVRRFSSDDVVKDPDPKDVRVPMYWLRPVQRLSNAPGMHRYLWDLHYPPMEDKDPEYPIAAIPHDTAPGATSPWVMTGQYSVVLTAGGKSFTQPLTVKMDPRVKTPTTAIQQQFTLSMQMYEDAMTVSKAVNEAEALAKKLKAAGAGSEAALKAVEDVLGAEDPGRGPRVTIPSTLLLMKSSLLAIEGALQSAETAPTTQLVTLVHQLHAAVPGVLQKWETAKQQAGK
jgi:photosystem II stability/assembly factor-like uncharacterized protein